MSKATSRKAARPTVKPVPRPSSKPAELHHGMWDRISQKAFELWEERGRRAGNDLEDWLDAEAIVMDEMHEARE